MNVAVIKFGGRCAYSTSIIGVGGREAIDVCRLLHLGGANVNVYEEFIKRDINFSFINRKDLFSSDIEKINEENDCLVILNGAILNSFGGITKERDKVKMSLVSKFKKRIFYILCDPQLLLANKKANEIKFTVDKVKYITQIKNTDELMNFIKSKDSLPVPEEIIYYPLEKFPLVNMRYLSEYEKKDTQKQDFLPGFNDNPKYDLIYGGNYRKDRHQYLQEFYCNSNLNVCLFGNNFESLKDKEDIILPTLEKGVEYKLFASKMNEGIATINVGDKRYIKFNDIAQRVYECLLSQVVSFIDSRYDFEKRIFNEPELKEFIYISSKEELESKIIELKNNKDFRKHIIDLQFKDTVDKFNEQDYCKSLVNLLKENL